MSRRTRCALFRLVAEARSPTDLRQHKKSGSHIGARIFCAQDCLRPGLSVCGQVPQTLRLSPTPLQCTRSVWTEGRVLRASTTKGKLENHERAPGTETHHSRTDEQASTTAALQGHQDHQRSPERQSHSRRPSGRPISPKTCTPPRSSGVAIGPLGVSAPSSPSHGRQPRAR